MNGALISLLGAALAFAQRPAFEVASIRPVSERRPLSPGDGPFFCPFGCFMEGDVKIDGARVDVRFMALDQLILRAYRIKPHQLSGPDWMRNQRFDILANLPVGSSEQQVPEMLQALLAERFKLAAHRENRDQPVYALRVDKGGLKLKPAAGVSNQPGDVTLKSPQGPIQARETDDGLTVTSGPWGPMRITPGQKGPEMELLSVTMPLLADALTQFMDRPVVDMTRLTGAYEFAFSGQDIHPFVVDKISALGLALPPGPSDALPAGGSAAASDPTGGSTIFKTMEKLGLRLERTKEPIEMLVVDRLEKSPTEN
jgi:uncharacterized protein (TIGR03435 family)